MEWLFKLFLAVFKLFTSVQLDPSQFSVLTVLAVPVYPPKAKAAVLLAPAPPNNLLAVFKSLTSVQLEPFHDSVTANSGGPSPPKPNAAVYVPALPPAPLAVFKSFTSVQLVPL